MDILIVKKYGVNNIGANPDWIEESRFISKNQSIPNGWIEITRSEFKIKNRTDKDAIAQWEAQLPKAVRNFKLKTERLKIKVQNKPSESYRLWKYLNPDRISKDIDVTLPPHSVVYDKQLTKKVHETYVIEKGLKKSVIVNVVNEDGSLGEEILKGTIGDYVFDPNSGPMPASESMVSRITKRQWIREDGTYRDDDLDIKTSVKPYLTQFEKNKEGQTRRNSIFTEVQRLYGTLVAIFKTGGDQEAAENIGKELLSKIGVEVTNYISSGSNVILTEIETIATNSSILDEYGLNINVTANPFVNATFPETIGMTVSEALQEKFKGNI